MATILPAGQHYGTICRQWTCDAFTISEVQYESGSKYALHGNEQASLLVTLEGSCAKKMRGKELLCARNAMLFIPAQGLQADTFSTDTTLLAVEFASSFFSGTRRGSTVETEVMLSRPDSAALGVRLVEEFKHVDRVSPLVFEGLLLHIVANAYREHAGAHGPKPPSWLQAVKDILNDSASQSVSIETIAKQVGVHPVHLSRSFRRFFKTTPGEYLRRVRVEFAANQLRETNRPLSEIADASGFADQAHLSRTFRRATNLSPLQFRRLSRNPLNPRVS
jgi:AraC family transcriptional regulator